VRASPRAQAGAAIRTIELMPRLDQIRQSIEARIAELNNQISALEATRAALQEDATTTVQKRSAPRSKRTNTANGHGADRASTRHRTSPKRTTAQRRVDVLLAGKLKAMLRDSADGLSAAAIARCSNAGRSQVLELLRELESAGKVRRSGSRRTSSWRAITDEERIAERAAELERLSRNSRAARW
jgi:hypothetical protein